MAAADAGLTDDQVLGAIAARDQAKAKQARPDWRTSTTTRLRGFAKSMRSAPTEAERRLWGLVRDRRLAAYKFRRQVPIGSYVVDTFCAEHRLIVELDGSQHAESGYDAMRDRWLAQQGYRVLRVWNNDMLARPSAVIETIWAHLQEQQQ